MEHGICLARRPTRPLRLGGLKIGGGAPVAIQSMTNTPTEDVAATTDQIAALAEGGAEVVRTAVPHRRAAAALSRLVATSPVPLVADIHFDHRLALAALDAGIHGLRLNPGNIGSRERVEEVVRAAAPRRVPIRIGVNAGSLEKDLLAAYGGPTAAALVESARRHVAILEEMSYREIKLSLKASSVPLTVAAYRLAAEAFEYPLHLGVTEAGTVRSGPVKSALGLGILLAEGIGDTIRVSLTGDPAEELPVAWSILRGLGLRRRGVEIISCPTCGRCRGDLEAIALAVESGVQKITTPLTVAVMGCEVNGPGEAREADVGLALGAGGGVLFRRGEKLGTLRGENLLERFLEEVRRAAAELEREAKTCPPTE